MLAGLIATGCGSEDDSSSSENSSTTAESSEPLVLYSGREEELVGPLYEQFEEETGIELEVRYADSPTLAAQLQEEGDATPADVFYAQDAGAIGAVADQLAPLSDELLDKLPAAYRDADGRWAGVTGRLRTMVFNTDELEESALPTSVMDVTAPAWKGALGIAPTNASFQAFVTALRVTAGEQEARAWLDALKANDVRTYEKNGQIVEAVASGEITAGLVNHYYLYEALASTPDAPIANHAFADGDIGNLVNVSAVGVLDASQRSEDAERLVEFLLTEGQDFIVESEAREYPLVLSADIEGNERYAELPALDDAVGPEFDLSTLGDELDATVKMIQEAGLAT
jgi:iron(III) transport system substrate-binding protein